MEKNVNMNEMPSTEDNSNDTGTSKDLLERIKFLEVEKLQMQNEFNVQRAKLKELFLQKETEYTNCLKRLQELQRELNDLKSRSSFADHTKEDAMLLKEAKAQEEIMSLQQMVQDTIEEATMCKAELEQNKAETNRLLLENRELRELQPKYDSSELGAQFNKPITLKTEEFDEESLRRAEDQYVNEEAEVLRAIVVQLQEEMKVMKERVRRTDEQIQIHTNSVYAKEKQKLYSNMTKEDEKLTKNCDACQIYEKKLQDLQKIADEDKETIDVLRKNLDESSADLRKAALLRKDLDKQWQQKREAHKMEVQMLREQVNLIEQQMLGLQQKFLETKEEIIRNLQQTTDERERCSKQIEALQADNDYLSGRYLKTAEEIENQYINLPNTIVELQELVLQQQHELIQARVGSEFESQKCVTSLDEIQLLRDQIDAINVEQRTYKKKVKVDIKTLQERLKDNILIQQDFEATKSALERKEAELNRQVSDFRVEIIELQDSNEKYCKLNTEYKAKIMNLQDDLATSEQVQNDFVKLSQKLQIAMEKLRHADTEVRWQDDEDIDSCPACNLQFTVTFRKIHCRHCGHIYCDNCLTKTVSSGPRKRLARVCDICHTLLTPNTAPYFSHDNQR